VRVSDLLSTSANIKEKARQKLRKRTYEIRKASSSWEKRFGSGERGKGQVRRDPGRDFTLRSRRKRGGAQKTTTQR